VFFLVKNRSPGEIVRGNNGSGTRPWNIVSRGDENPVNG
jgi:hypothetical protein